MLDINVAALEKESIEVERQINRLQQSKTENFEAPNLKTVEVVDSTETSSDSILKSIDSSCIQKFEGETPIEQTSESMYDKTTNVDTISEYSQLTNPQVASSGDHATSNINSKGEVASRLLTDLNELTPALITSNPAPLILETPVLNTYNNIFGHHSTASRRSAFNQHGVIIAAHRGGSKGIEPENTMRAFRRAIDLGVQVIELDVSCSIRFTNHCF